MFGIDRTILDPCFYDAINDFDSDLTFWLDECRKAGGPVLELGCGHGAVDSSARNGGNSNSGSGSLRNDAHGPAETR